MKDGYYILIDGQESALKKAKEILGTTAKQLTGKEEKDVIAKKEEQESGAAAGFGGAAC